MLPLPQNLKEQFVNLLNEKAIPQEKQSHYLKWLRYYLDFAINTALPDHIPKHFPISLLS